MKTVIVKETVTNKRDVKLAINEAKKSTSNNGTTKVGILFTKLKNTLILM